MDSAVKASHVDLGRTELRLRFQLRKCDLIGELSLSEEGLAEIVASLHHVYRSRTGRSLSSVCKSYPVTMAVFLVFTGVYRYNAGGTSEYWPSVWDSLPWPDTQQNRALIGRTFLSVLQAQEFGLTQLTRATRRIYVDQILLHAAIPVGCLENFFEFVVMSMINNPNISLAEVPRSYLRRPVSDFLDTGGRVAENFVSRCVNLLREMARTPGAPKTSELAAKHGLARHIVDALGKWLQSGAMARHTSSSTNSLRVMLDPYQHGVVIEVPSISVNEGYRSYTLQITAGDWTEEKQAFLDVESTEMRTLPFKLRAPQPCDEYYVAIPSLSKTFVARGIRPDEPTYFSVESGRRLSTSALPSGSVWVVAPREWRPVGDNGQDLVVEDLPALPGRWRSMRALTISTQGTMSVTWLDQDGKVIDDVTAAVELGEENLPRLIGDLVELPFEAITQSPPVYIAPPKLWLPVRTGSCEYERWRIQLRELGSFGIEHRELAPVSLSEVTQATKVSDDARGVLVDLSHERLLGSKLGSYEVLVLGPLGFDATLRFAVLEGVKVTSYPRREQWDPRFDVASSRLFLESAKDLVVSVDGGTVSETAHGYRVDPDQHVGELLVSVGEKGGSSRVTFPYRIAPVEWGVIDLEEASTCKWATNTLILRGERVEHIARHGILLRLCFREPTDLRCSLTVNGEAVQTIPLRCPGGPTHRRIDLASFSDCIRKHARHELCLSLEIDRADIDWDIPLANIQFDWRVEDLVVEVVGDGPYALFATWTDISQPEAPRKLVLNDLWRPGNRLEIPIEKGRVAIEADIPIDKLLPGRYEVQFIASQPWSKSVRRPVRISPPTTISVGQAQWESLFSQRATPVDWLVCASAWMDLGRRPRGDVTPPDFEEWTTSELSALCKLAVDYPGRGADGRLSELVKHWGVERLMDAVDAYLSVESGADGRKAAISLGLHMSGGATTGITLHRIHSSWPTLGILHGISPLPRVVGHIRFAWGMFAQFREPRTSMRPPEGAFHQYAPGWIFSRWYERNEHMLRETGQQLQEAVHQLRELARNVSKIILQNFPASMGVVHAHSHLLEAMKLAAGTGRETPTSEVSLAYVTAVLSLFQRLVAWNPSRMGKFASNFSRFEPLAVCPDLHDYYLLLSEMYLRTDQFRGE